MDSTLVPRRHASVLLLAAVLCACGPSGAPGETAAVPDPQDQESSLEVVGSALVLTLPDGRVLRGVELAGATVHLALEGGHVATLRLASITPDPDVPEILRHDFQKPDAKGGWEPACSPNAYGERWGFPVSLPPGHPGREGEITITCASGAVAKCARLRYLPWMTQGTRGEDPAALHASCVHMIRADYCGDGQAHTKDGTSIDNFDDYGIEKRGAPDDASYVFEAGWSPQGAVCVNHTRWSDLLTMDQLKASCQRLAAVPVCSEDTARSLGAQVFNYSRLLPAANGAAP